MINNYVNEINKVPYFEAIAQKVPAKAEPALALSPVYPFALSGMLQKNEVRNGTHNYISFWLGILFDGSD